MVKSIVSTVCALLIFFTGAMFESRYIKKTFTEFNSYTKAVYDKLEDETATVDDVLALQKRWVKNKEYLHIFIPHGEIKEMDLWISECVRYTRDENYKEAVSKLEVVMELNEQIPKTFLLRLENIF